MINASTTLEQVYSLYYQFLDRFPPQIHGIISFLLALLLIYAIYKIIKRNFIFLILVVLLLPQAVPILKTVWESAFTLIKFLFEK